jgi:hypothetical protein
MQGKVPLFGAPFVAEYMIEMAMSVKQQNRLKLCRFNKAGKLVPLLLKITTRVNNAALSRIVIQDVGIFLDGIKCK